MNEIVILNICSLVVCMAAIVIIAVSVRRGGLSRAAGLFALVCMGILLFVCVSNILEHLSVSDFLDEYEGFAGNLFALFFILLLYMDSIHRELQQRTRNERQIQEDLEEKTTLLKEIHHRVKNNLQIVSSLLSLQGSAQKDEKITEILNTARNRIMSIATVHEIIYSSRSISRLAAAGFLEPIISNLCMTYDSTDRKIEIVRSMDENIYIDVDQAIPLGLILNELFTNSLKHGLGAGASGRIDVSLRRNGALIELRVSDSGPGPAKSRPAGGRGIGMDIVRSLIKQIGGEMRIDTGQGAGVTVSFPEKG